MPVFKSNSVFSIFRNVTAFLNLEAGITRSTLEQHGWGQGVTPPLDTQTAQRQPASKAAGVGPENLVWMFSYGSGRSGTTWFTNMIQDLSGYELWKSPRVGSLFGDFYYDHDASKRNAERPDHIMGPERGVWIQPLRSFILEGAALRYPELTQRGAGGRYLVISEHHGSLGAPLIMEALPESRLLLMMRDPRDVAASTREASKTTGWVRKLHDKEKTLADIDPIAFMKAHVEQNSRIMGHARQAYDAHQGPKAVLKYEDLRADTLSAMRQTLSTLGLRCDNAELAKVVEKHSWENIPEDRKGEGKFHRKATPGGWREDLSPEEVRIVEEGFESLLDEFYPQKAS